MSGDKLHYQFYLSPSNRKGNYPGNCHVLLLDGPSTFDYRDKSRELVGKEKGRKGKDPPELFASIALTGKETRGEAVFEEGKLKKVKKLREGSSSLQLLPV